MKAEDVRKVVIIGAGTMGQQIGLQCALYGCNTVYYDMSEAALEGARARIRGYLERFQAQGSLTAETAAEVEARLRFTTDAAEAGAEADLLSESVPEDPALKGRVLAQFNALCPARTIFTTNSSSLLPSMMAEASGRPAQFAAFHFHTEVWTSNVADVCPHAGTAQETVDFLAAFARRIGQIPIVLKKESYGYVFNAMYNQLNTAAITLAANGVASVEDVDRAWMGVMKMPVGPFGMLDGVGLDTVWHITDYWAKATGDAQLLKNAAFLRTYVDQGFLGVKSGRGFYAYPDPAFGRAGFLTVE